MFKQNVGIEGNAALDKESERYAEEVYHLFDGYRQMNLGYFGNRYYPTMTCVCTDSNNSILGEDFSRRPCMKEYDETQMLNEIGRKFCPNGIVEKWQDLVANSHYGYPIGQCAEQHAANELLKGLQSRIDIKTDISFGKPIRCVTGEEDVFCQNCKDLFDI